VRVVVYNKLVRDEIPKVIEEDGKKAKISKVSGMAFRQALENKMLEELKEWQQDYELEELADLYEVLRAMTEQAGHAFDDVERIADEKRKRRGGFFDGVCLERVEESSEVEADKEIILTGLRAYNISQIGKREFPALLIEAKDKEDRRIGAIAGQISWDYFNVYGLYVEPEFRGLGYGRALVQTAAYEAKKRFNAPQVELVTSFPEVQAFLTHIGCERKAELKDMPKGFTNAFFYFNTAATDTPVGSFSIQESLEGETGDWLQEKNKEALKMHEIDRTKRERTVLAMDENENPLGGVYGYLERDWLYVSLLWVDEAARGKGIGNLVMDEIEAWAEEQGIRNFYVGTGQFQARPFYEKRGYRVINTCVDQPIGYECYTLVKQV